VIVNVVPVSSLESFDYFIYPEQNPVNQNYFYNQVYAVNQALNDFGSKFMQASQHIYEKINDSNVIRAAKAALRYAVGLSHPNAVVYLKTIDELRAAQPVMQRYIMANPVVREMYNQQLIDGYNDTYIDNEPGFMKALHYDFRRVMDSVIQDKVDDEGNYEWVAPQYYEDLIAGDRDLDFQEKINILNTWDVIDQFMKSGKEDPTNPFNGTVG
jgi:hypothetical protein